jgi:glycogen synthase
MTGDPSTSRPAPRVLWITERYPPQKGGMAVSCERLVSGLRRRGTRLDVIAFTRDPAAARIETIERDRGADFRLALELAPGNAAQLGWSAVRREELRGPYTAVVGFGAGLAGFIAVTYAAWLGVRATVLVRGNDFDRDWFDMRRGHYTREALMRAGTIGTVSPEMGARIRALVPGREVVWTPNGVDPAQWELLAADRAARDEVRAELGADGRRVIGIFGEMKYKKRVPLWLGALRDSGRMDRVGLLVVGRLDEETARVLDDPSLAPRQRRLDFCRQDQLPALYAACDFVALPSLFEGMPNVLLEAMAAGAVPIASTAGAMAAVISDPETGFLFPPEDRAGAARAITRALDLTDPQLAALSARVRHHVAANFSPARELDLIAALILR